MRLKVLLNLEWHFFYWLVDKKQKNKNLNVGKRCKLRRNREVVRELKKKAVVFLGLCLAMSLMLEEMPKMIYFNVTTSLPQGFYLRIPGKECRRGDYIVYEPSEEVKMLIIKNGWGDGKRDFLKKVGATTGGKYSVDVETLKFEIEGKYIGQVYETDNTGNVLPKLRGEFEVPKGYVLPIATSARSFDGRYSGAIPKSQIKARVVPILTW